MNCQKIINKCFFVLFCGLTAVIGNTAFPIPEGLHDNVAFWKKIYTEVSMQKGLLHDRDYPLIIYDTVTVGLLYGNELDKYVDKSRKKIISAINNIKKNAPQTWGKREIEISELFKNAPPKAFEDAENRIRFQLGQRERFLDGLKRSGAFIDTIRALLRQRKLPEELAWLPHVESSFNYLAQSKTGASGIWQFMPETGKRFLRIDAFIDERNDPIFSTIAAARLLELNYQKLRSWPLAVTAYNYGLSGMLRAVKNTGSTDLGLIISKHQSPIFRFASKNFYSCFLAVIEIASEPSRYFGTIEYDQPAQVLDIKIISTLKVDKICSIFGYTKDRFGSLNPFLCPDIINNKKPVPAGIVIRIEKVVEWREIVSNGYSFNDSEKKTDENLTLKQIAGSNISFAAHYEKKRVSDSLTYLHRNWLNITFVNTEWAIISVLSDENTGLYASWLGVSLPEIEKINRLNNKVSLQSGQKLILPLKTEKIRQFLSARENYHAKIRHSFFEKYHIKEIHTRVLKRGDLIWDFCKAEVDVPVWLLESMNQNLDLNNISEGNTVNIPVLIKVEN